MPRRRLACAQSHRLRGAGRRGRGQARSCPPAASPVSPTTSDLKEPTCVEPSKASSFSKHRFLPPFFWESTPVRQTPVESPLFSPLPAAPAARSGCCRAREPFHLPIASALLPAAAPSQVTAHRFSCAIYTPDVPRLNRMVSEHRHPTPIVMNHVSRPRGAAYLPVAGSPPPFGTGAASHPTDGRKARRVTQGSPRGRHLKTGYSITPCQIFTRRTAAKATRPRETRKRNTKHQGSTRGHCDEAFVYLLLLLRDQKGLVLLFLTSSTKTLPLCETARHVIRIQWKKLQICYADFSIPRGL